MILSKLAMLHKFELHHQSFKNIFTVAPRQFDSNKILMNSDIKQGGFDSNESTKDGLRFKNIPVMAAMASPGSAGASVAESDVAVPQCSACALTSQSLSSFEATHDGPRVI